MRDPEPTLLETDGGARCVRCPYWDKPELKRRIP
jgi:hypothetical protein